MLSSLGFDVDFLSSSQAIGGKNISSITYLVSSGMLNLNQSTSSISVGMWVS